LVEAWEYVVRHPDLLLEWTLEHLLLTFLACVIAVVIGVLIGVFIAREGWGRLADIVLYLAEIMMTIPSLALFGLLMAILSSIGAKSIGFLPAIIALVAYALLPILRNTYIAILEVDPAMIEAGKGMGMSEQQLMYKIKLPLAVPVIMAGLRNAIVMTIAIATIAALIGSGGLGVPIFRGIRNARMDLIIVGGVSVAILGLLVDYLMSWVEKWVTPKGLKSR